MTCCSLVPLEVTFRSLNIQCDLSFSCCLSSFATIVRTRARAWGSGLKSGTCGVLEVSAANSAIADASIPNNRTGETNWMYLLRRVRDIGCTAVILDELPLNVVARWHSVETHS